MYYGAIPSTFEKARLLRNNTTPEESILWEKLRNKQIINVFTNRIKMQNLGTKSPPRGIWDKEMVDARLQCECF